MSPRQPPHRVPGCGDIRIAGVPTPKRQLVDFERVHIAAGASTAVTFTVAAEQFELVAKDGTRSSYPGKYALHFTNGVDTMAVVDVTIG